MKENAAQKCLDFIGESVSCYHAVEAVDKRLLEAGGNCKAETHIM